MSSIEQHGEFERLRFTENLMSDFQKNLVREDISAEEKFNIKVGISAVRHYDRKGIEYKI